MDSTDCIEDNTLGPDKPTHCYESGHVQTHNCWICQEELSSEVLLVGHYENHMINE